MDAATKLMNQVAGLGVAIRDSWRNFVAAAQKQIKFHGNVLAAETEAILLGIEIAETAGCKPLILESDCQEAVDLITGRKCSKAEISWTISDIQEGLQRLNNANVQHVSRLCNDAAHSLAKWL